MKIRAFNEIMKDLEGAGSQGRDGEISALANKLHEQGIASTMLEAREKAKSMLETDKDLAADFTAKKENLTKYNDPRNNPKYRFREEKIQEMRKRAMSGKPAPVSPTIPYREPRQREEEERVTQIVDMPAPVSRPQVQTIIEKDEPEQAEEKKPRRENPNVDINDVFNFGKRE